MQDVSFRTCIDEQPPGMANRDPIWRCQRLTDDDGSRRDSASCLSAMDAWSQPVGRCGTLIRCASGEIATNAEQHYIESPCHADRGCLTSYEGWDGCDDLLYGLFHPPQGDPDCHLFSIDDIDTLFDEMAPSPVTSLIERLRGSF